MTFLKVLELSQKLQAGNYDEVLAFLLNTYKPRTCIELVEYIKNDIFLHRPIYPVDRKVGERNYKLNLEYNNFMVVENDEDTIIAGTLKYKVNFPNILSFENQFINVVSIIKSVYVEDEWVDIDSYDIDSIKQLYNTLGADDIALLGRQYERYQKRVEDFDYINIGTVEEKLTFDQLVSFLFENYKYDSDNLREILLSLMRHFHFTYSDFNHLSFFEALQLIKVGNKLVSEEQEDK